MRCAICRDTWFVQPPKAESAEPEPPPAPEEPPGAKLLPPAPQKARRSKSLPKLPGRRTVAIAAAGLVAVLTLPLLGEGVSKARELVGRLAVGAARADLSFRQVTSEVIGADGAQILVVEGEIANGGSGPAPLPPLEFLVRNGDEQVLATWTETPPRPTLGPGETTRFASRLASPPADGRQVRVQFTKAAGVAMAAR